jgi:phosphoglycerate kinase
MARFISEIGFGAVHRKHASVYELAKLLPHAAGDLISAEVSILKQLTSNPERPYGVVLGGAKVSDKIAVISNLLDKVDVMAIGGGMLFTFLAAQGKEIGKSLVETDLIPTVKDLIARAEKLGVKFLLPTDIVVAPEFSENAKPTLVSADDIPHDQMGIRYWAREVQNSLLMKLQSAKLYFGMVQWEFLKFSNFAAGTKSIAQALTQVFWNFSCGWWRFSCCGS